MNVQTIGSTRPMLTLPYGSPNSSRPACERRPAGRSGILSPQELRRIVAEMVG